MKTCNKNKIPDQAFFFFFVSDTLTRGLKQLQKIIKHSSLWKAILMLKKHHFFIYSEVSHQITSITYASL